MDERPAGSARREDADQLGDVGVHGDGTDLAIVTYGSGISLAAGRRSCSPPAIQARIVDLQRLGHVDADKLGAAVGEVETCSIVRDRRHPGSPGEALMYCSGHREALARIAAGDRRLSRWARRRR